MQTITGETLIDIPKGHRLTVESQSPIIAAVFPKMGTEGAMVENMLNTAQPTTRFTSTNIPTMDNVAIIRPYNGTSVTVKTHLVSVENGARAMGDYTLTDNTYSPATQYIGGSSAPSHSVPPSLPRPPVNGLRSSNYVRPPMRSSVQSYKPQRSSYFGSMYERGWMDSVKDWWAKFPMWGKITVGVIIVALVGLIIYMLWMKFGSKSSSVIPSGFTMPTFF